MNTNTANATEVRPRPHFSATKRNGAALLVALALLVPSDSAAQRTNARARQPVKAKPSVRKGPCELTAEMLASTDWRLYAMSFQVVRASGVPVRLKADGTVVSDAIVWIRTWKIEDDGTLTIREQDGTVAYRFSLDGDACVLASVDCAKPASEAALMGPRGTNFASYLAKQCPSLFGKHSP